MKKLVLAAMLGLMVASGPAGALTLPKLFQGGNQAAAEPRQGGQPLILAQSGDAAIRVQQLEEEIRQLNGRIEEMSFQLLQMQEQIRKAQEDNEFRFQELEKSENGAAGKPAATASNRAPAAQPPRQEDDVARVIETPQPGQGRTQNQGSGRNPDTGAPETTLGSIEFDQGGNPVGARRNENANNSSGLPGVDSPSNPRGGARPDPQQTASLGSENDVYQAAYGHVLSGDYQLAEREFNSYLESYPKGARAADANFWLGEAQYSQGKFNEAAKTFLNAHQTYAKSPKAPEMLLKLGMSLAALDNKETACATLKEVSKRYPSAPRSVLGKVTSEQKRLSC
ncbi:tol-pal system protein YbgF [Rhizobium sp. LC145]|uniref:tol-pal system protein YbgF n=1 Tax=Rhizobium sp. LC145 TaxID=1120688 RepID=UPI000629E884|nr:tol-pal system protein YbgF [Rhizobium sp. LC145]KKX30388.1 tol-pal system protein [Rhizobium sp. LC145]TKT56731.1 tol-pal system protein YbgF [Rhizobiaceae bacterium LC148]